MTSSCNVSKFLLSTCQYTYLQVHITQNLSSLPPPPPLSLSLSLSLPLLFLPPLSLSLSLPMSLRLLLTFLFQEFLSRITQFVTSVPFSRAFLLGHTHLSIGELEKALQCFVMATGGIGQGTACMHMYMYIESAWCQYLAV